MFSTEDILDILKTSRRNNALQGITGLLIYHEGSIMQILEGEEKSIQPLFDKIARDKRHKRVIKIHDERIESGSFREWSMAFKEVSNDEWSQLDGYLHLDKDNFQGIHASGNPHLITLIKSFSNVNQLNL
jgi:hypothetical protein